MTRKEHKVWLKDLITDAMKAAEHRTPRIKVPISFEQPSTGPYTVTCMPSLAYLEEVPLKEAVAFFLRYGYPPHEEGSAGVFDMDGVIVLGWHINNVTNAPAWYGTQQGFDEMCKSPLVDPLLLELAMLQAREAPWG